ncbi:hypothetical protein ACLQ3C_21485, partial [Gordonia sp. DT30]|uniref:hypothetical protein n=1 Tax=Gordonia sp. DT30 TaxID=3416546 RepID=UPI003CF3D674
RNMFAQDGHFNMVPYRVMENEWSDFARYGARLEVEIDPDAPIVGGRPSTVKVDGEAYSARTGRLLREAHFENIFRNDGSQSYQRRFFKRKIIELLDHADRSDG